jgi:hypothetical protein
MMFAEQAAAVTPEQFRKMIEWAAEAEGVTLHPFHPVEGKPLSVIVAADGQSTVRQFGRFIDGVSKFGRARLRNDDFVNFALSCAGGFGMVEIDYDPRAYGMTLELAEIWKKSLGKHGVTP